jgi:hypothetical protein
MGIRFSAETELAVRRTSRGSGCGRPLFWFGSLNNLGRLEGTVR